MNKIKSSSYCSYIAVVYWPMMVGHLRASFIRFDEPTRLHINIVFRYKLPRLNQSCSVTRCRRDYGMMDVLRRLFGSGSNRYIVLPVAWLPSCYGCSLLGSSALNLYHEVSCC